MGGWSGANAYMLMYRKIEKGRDAVFPSREEVPEHVKQDVIKEEERAEREKAEWNQKLNSVSVSCLSADHTEPIKISVMKKESMRSLKEKAWKMMGLEKKGVVLENVRLREMDTNTYRSYAPKEKALDDEEATIEQMQLSYKRIYVETRLPGEEWPTINFNDLKVEVMMYDPKEKVMMKAKQVFISKWRKGWWWFGRGGMDIGHDCYYYYYYYYYYHFAVCIA